MGMKWIIVPVSLLSLAFAADSTTAVKRIPVRGTEAISGRDLFREYCAVCHGNAGQGNGPAAAALKTPPSDLTTISQRNGGAFPAIKIQRLIAGEVDEPLAHGSKDMPVWGNIFQHMSANPDLGAVRIYNLLKYVEQLQTK